MVEITNIISSLLFAVLLVTILHQHAFASVVFRTPLCQQALQLVSQML